jgi:hypothetical protein
MTLPSAKTNKFVVTMGLAILMLLAFSLTGFSIVNMAPNESVSLAAPNLGEESPGQVNVIKNGGFEETDENSKPPGVARYWNGYTNGQAVFGFYDEQWPEAVLNGKHAQLLEINLVEANILDRVIAVHQTVGVSANSQYDLTLWAIMRTQAPEIDRNKSEVEMHWGVDFTGAGDYNNVTEWHLMPLTEQYRLGSTGEYPQDVPLRYEMVTGTIQTGENNQITLFLRGLKKFPTGTEVDFNIDDVSLIGAAGGPAPTATPTLVPGATPEMPTSGAITSENTSMGSVLLGGLVLVALGSTAAFNLLKKRHWS